MAKILRRSVACYSAERCDDASFGVLVLDPSTKSWQWTYVRDVYRPKNKSKSVTVFSAKDDDKDLRNWLNSCKNAPLHLYLVLESPHVDEYKNGKPYFPARGKTGENIYKSLPNMLNQKSFKSLELGAFMERATSSPVLPIVVKVMNSIRYQCSLGIQPISRMIVEENWVDLWFDPNVNGEEDFEQRIERANEESNAFFINACTEGVNVPLRQMVSNALEQVLGPNQNFCETNHPVSWRSNNLPTL